MIRQKAEEYFQDKTKIVRIVATIVILAAIGLMCSILFSAKTEKIEPKLTPIEEETAEDEIMVDVKGNVKNPGVYTLPENSRMKDAIKAAGGFTLQEDEAKVNLAQKLRDGEMIVIGQNKINLNTADLQELKTLSGIGDTLAKRIVKYREENGGFYSIDEIKQVRGIGDGMYEKLKDMITV